VRVEDVDRPSAHAHESHVRADAGLLAVAPQLHVGVGDLLRSGLVVQIDPMPPIDREFAVEDLNATIEAPGSVSVFRATARLRDPGEIEAAWREADTWFGATEGAGGDDSTLASISAERSRALGWLRASDASPP